MKYLIYTICIVALLWLNLKSGSTGWMDFSLSDLFSNGLVGLDRSLVIDVRLPAVITAVSAGAGLATAGLIMQVLFQNHLAGPGVLGVSGGGALAVSFAILAGIGGGLSLAVFSMLGSVLVLLLIMLASLRFRSNATVLILGLMLGYIISATINILQYAAEADRLQQFVFWTMGGFQSSGWADLRILSGIVLLSILILVLFRSKLDIMLLGEEQMSNLGLNMKTWRLILLALTGLIVGVVTAYCGPLAFVGLASPHIARIFTRSDTHGQMLPSSILIGVILCLLSLYLMNAPWISLQLPLNAILSIFGAPVVIWLLIRRPQHNAL